MMFIPCLIRQSLKVARMATEDVAVHEAILREMLRHVSGLDLNRPPLVSQWIYRQVREKTGQIDPKLAAKHSENGLTRPILLLPRGRPTMNLWTDAIKTFSSC